MTMTPSTPAGGAVACPHRLACIDCGDEPATVSVEAVLALVEADKEYDAAKDACRNAPRSYTAGANAGDRLHAAEIRRRAALARCADELESLTRGEK